MKKLAWIAVTILISGNVLAAPHFYLQMDNRSNNDTSITFKPVVGDISLDPVLANHTPLKAHEKSMKYAVNIPVLDPKNTMRVTFTGKEDCNFELGFWGPGNPKVTVFGDGCYGGGYEITGQTVIVYVSDINYKKA